MRLEAFIEELSNTIGTALGKEFKINIEKNGQCYIDCHFNGQLDVNKHRHAVMSLICSFLGVSETDNDFQLSISYDVDKSPIIGMSKIVCRDIDFKINCKYPVYINTVVMDAHVSSISTASLVKIGILKLNGGGLYLPKNVQVIHSIKSSGDLVLTSSNTYSRRTNIESENGAKIIVKFFSFDSVAINSDDNIKYIECEFRYASSHDRLVMLPDNLEGCSLVVEKGITPHQYLTVDGLKNKRLKIRNYKEGLSLILKSTDGVFSGLDFYDITTLTLSHKNRNSGFIKVSDCSFSRIKTINDESPDDFVMVMTDCHFVDIGYIHKAWISSPNFWGVGKVKDCEQTAITIGGEHLFLPLEDGDTEESVMVKNKALVHVASLLSFLSVSVSTVDMNSIFEGV